MTAHDIVIRGGTIVDGTGGPTYVGDIAIDGEVIAAVGGDIGRGRREIDASGTIVAPGFVDLHTHYDGQAIWDSRLEPSTWHGVTTVVLGNCGVGFAPVAPHHRDQLIDLMEGVEELPTETLRAGLDWEWSSFPEYMDAVDRRGHDTDIATQIPHAALRLHVMDTRCLTGEAPTEEDLALTTQLVEEALYAGALGFSTSRTANHRSATGDTTPTLHAPQVELLAAAEGLRRAGRGVLQAISDFDDLDAEFELLQSMVRHSGRPLSMSILAKRSRPGQWRELLDRIERSNEEGLAILGQVSPRAIGALIGLELSMHPLEPNPVFREIAGLPLADQAAAMLQPGFRERLVEAAFAQRGELVLEGRSECDLTQVFELGDPPNYEPPPSESIAARASRSGCLPEDLLVERLAANGGTNVLYLPALNYVSGNLDDAREMLVHPYTVPGLSDGGAHMGHICDASFPTTLLAHWARDRERDQLDLSFVVRAQSARTAAALGLHDRGILAPGYRADLNVIDHEGLTLHHPEVRHDLPGGALRVVQRVDGYLHTFLRGVETQSGGEPTDELPGRLVRGAQPPPQPTAAGSP
jgi:N-acyl-D-aspartate/D-glutamate deacylase